VQRLVRVQVRGGDQQRGRLERVHPADRVERVAHVVAAGRNRDPRREQLADRGQAARYRRGGLPALQVQVRDRQRHHGEAGVAHLGEHVGQRGGVQGTQAHAMAGGDPLGEAARADLPGQLADGEHAGIELLVGVQVDVDAAALGEAQQPGELLERVVGQVRAATEHVHAEVQRALQGGGVGDAAGQQADLQVEHVTQLLAQPEHGAHAAQRVVGVQRQVDVAAYRRDAGGQVPGQRVPGPAVDVLGGEPPGVVAPGVDGRGQVAVRGVAGRPAERLVQVACGSTAEGSSTQPGSASSPTPTGAALAGRTSVTTPSASRSTSTGSPAAVRTPRSPATAVPIAGALIAAAPRVR
jgi:hypothetical protein